MNSIKYKEYEISLDSIPAIISGAEKLYPKAAVADFLDYLPFVYHAESRATILTFTELFINKDQILYAIETRDRAIAEKEARQARIESQEESKRKQLVEQFKNAFAVYVPEFNATFVVPFDYTKHEVLVDAVSTGIMSTDILKGVLENVLYQNGKAFAPEYTLDVESKEWLTQAFKPNAVKTVQVSKVTEQILELAEEYIKRITTAAMDK